MQGVWIFNYVPNKIRSVFFNKLIMKILENANFDNDLHKAGVIEDYMEKANSTTPEQFMKILENANFDNDFHKAGVIECYIKINPTTPDKFVEIFKAANFDNDFHKAGVIEDYMEKENSITSKQFLAIFKSANFSEDFDKVIVIDQYMEKENSITPNQFLAIFKAANFSNDFNKTRVIDQYMEKENSITHDEFLAIFKSANFTDDTQKIVSINQYMEKENSITHDEFLAIFKSANFTDDTQKIVSINQYMEKANSITPDQFLEIFKAANFSNDFDKTRVIEGFFKQEDAVINFLDNIKKFNITDEGQKLDVIERYFSNKKNQDFDKLLTILSSDQIGDLKYRVDLICDTLKNIYPDSTDETAENLSKLGNDLYPNVEYLRIELFQQAIDKKLINKDNIQFLKLDNIESSDLLLNVLTYAQSKIPEIDELDILKLTKGRPYSRYESLSNLLRNATPGNVFSQDGMAQIQGIFDGNINEFTALDILSYFDAKGRVEDFHHMIKKDFKQNIKNEFKPSKDQLLISEEELGKIAKSIGDDSVKDKFCTVGNLCQYIKDKVGELPVLNEDFTINFQNSIIDEKTQTKLNNKLKEAFKPSANDNDIVGFLSLVINPAQQDTDTSVITDTNKRKLLEFFDKSRVEISQLLQKEGGFDKFVRTLSTISDGCSANIGNQFHIALYHCLLEDKSDAILYQILSQDIITPILNKGGEVILNQPDPLSNTKVRNYHYSPEALFDKVAKVFYDPTKEKKIGRNATDVIRDKYGDDKASEIIELLSTENNPNFDQDAAQIAAYLTLSHSELIPKDRLQSILGSNISLNDENKEKLTNILEVPNSVVDEITIDKITIEVPSSTVEPSLTQKLMECLSSMCRR